MIRYSKAWWSVSSLFTWYGSAVPRALPFALVAALVAGLCAGFASERLRGLWGHPYPYQMFAFIVGFLIVFRTQLAYSRYWEGRSQLQTLTGKLTDFAVQCDAFDRASLSDVPTDDERAAYHHFRDTIVHLVSLMHGVALATLRDDFDFDNLRVHDSQAPAPNDNMRLSQATALKRNATAVVTVTQRSGVAPEGAPSTLDQEAVAPDPHTANRATPAEHAVTVDTQDAGGELLTYNYGSYSALDALVLRTSHAREVKMHRAMPLPVLGGVSQAEGMALGAFTTSGAKEGCTPTLDERMHGLFLGDGTYSPAPTERVQTLHAWLQQEVAARMAAGGMSRISTSVQARIHTSLAAAIHGFEQCQKLNEAPFPFPWAQGITFLLVAYIATAPIMIASFISSPAVAAVAAFFAVHTYVMVNEIARDIEEPFHYDPNQLPLPQMQYKFNERLLAVTKTERPGAFTDVTTVPAALPAAAPAASVASVTARPQGAGDNVLRPLSVHGPPSLAGASPQGSLIAYSSKAAIPADLTRRLSQRLVHWDSVRRGRVSSVRESPHIVNVDGTGAASRGVSPARAPHSPSGALQVRARTGASASGPRGRPQQRTPHDARAASPLASRPFNGRGAAAPVLSEAPRAGDANTVATRAPRSGAYLQGDAAAPGSAESRNAESREARDHISASSAELDAESGAAAPGATAQRQRGDPSNTATSSRPKSIATSALFRSTAPAPAAASSKVQQPASPLPPPRELQTVKIPASSPSIAVPGARSAAAVPAGADPFGRSPSKLPFLQPMATAHAHVASSQGSNVLPSAHASLEGPAARAKSQVEARQTTQEAAKRQAAKDAKEFARARIVAQATGRPIYRAARDRSGGARRAGTARRAGAEVAQESSTSSLQSSSSSL